MALVEIMVKRSHYGAPEACLDWSALDKGDQVAVVFGRNTYYGTSVKVYTVDRLTATQIVMDDGSKWYRKNGQQVAGQSMDELVHPHHDTVITSRQQAEARAFNRALEELSKTKTSVSYQELLARRDQVADLAARFGARITILEGKRRTPDVDH